MTEWMAVVIAIFVGSLYLPWVVWLNEWRENKLSPWGPILAGLSILPLHLVCGILAYIGHPIAFLAACIGVFIGLFIVWILEAYFETRETKKIERREEQVNWGWKGPTSSE